MLRKKFGPLVLLIFLTACGNSTTSTIPAATVAPLAEFPPAIVYATPITSNLPPAKATAMAQLTLTSKASTSYPAATTGTITPTATNLLGTPPCKAVELSGQAGWQGATGSMAGYLNLTNRGTKDCTLQGLPEVQLLDGQGNALAVNYSSFCNPCPEPVQDQTRLPAIATQTVTAYFNQLVNLSPGESAGVILVWRNWCKAKPESFKLKVTLPGNQGHLTVPVLDFDGKPTASTPRCDASEAPSSFSIGPFENKR